MNEKIKYFIITTNPTQDNQLEKFKEMKSKTNYLPAGKLTELVKKFVECFQNNKKIPLSDSRIARDVFLGALRKIDYSYREILKHGKGPIVRNNNGILDIEDDDYDIRESMFLVFFVNTKFALEIAKKAFRQNFLKQNQNLLKNVTTIRNYLAHVDEKFFTDKRKVTVRSCPNPQFKNGLDVLEIFDIETFGLIAEIHFSVRIFYTDICSLIEKILIKGHPPLAPLAKAEKFD